MYKIPANTVLAGQRLIYVPECHSTNSLLMELNERSGLPDGSVLITDHQTSGRGQRGNFWEAAPGLNLTFSILLKPAFLHAKYHFHLNMAVSLAVADALQPYVQAHVELKWPNDIMISGRKVGGILIENQISSNTLDCSIVGIGININQPSFMNSKAAALVNFSNGVIPLSLVFDSLLETLDRAYLDLKRGEETLKERYMAKLFLFNQDGVFRDKDEQFPGQITDVDENGRLCISTENGIRRYLFKEVEFV